MVPPTATRARLVTVVAWLAPLMGAIGCDSVDLGTAPADVNACRPSQAFFYDRIWPEFLNKDFGGKTCGESRCHDATSGRALLLTPPTSVWTDRTRPMPMDWLALYKSATEQLQCTNVPGSRLLQKPNGLQVHSGGKLIEPEGVEAGLVRMWVETK